MRGAGLRRKYVAGVLRFDGPLESRITAIPFPKEDESSRKPTYQLLVRDQLEGGKLSFEFDIFALEHDKLVSSGHGYEKILISGWRWLGADVWFVGLAGFVLNVLKFFYSLIPNWGVAIIILTLCMKFVTLPLTLKQMRSMRAMQEHKPALDEIRKKYRNDTRKVQEETMAYYRKAGINPLAQMAGCLPMFLQMPIFIALFVVLGRAVELRGAPFMLWITDLSMPDVVTSAVGIPWIMPMGLTVLPFLMAITTYFQTKQTITDPNQKMMVYLMPIMMFAFSGMMPSGLVLYWTVSNLFGIVQYMVIGSPTGVKPAVAGAEVKFGAGSDKGSGKKHK